jgi:WD40 repeat protein
VGLAIRGVFGIKFASTACPLLCNDQGRARCALRTDSDSSFSCSGVVMRVLFQAKELNVISAAEDGEIRVWDLVSQRCKATLKASQIDPFTHQS